VILEGVGDYDDGEEVAPLGEDLGIEVKDDRDEREDALDGSGLRPEIGVGVRRGGLSRRHVRRRGGGRLQPARVRRRRWLGLGGAEVVVGFFG
jgi:hypothetical protein